MTSRRLYVPVVLGTLAAGGFAFFAASRTWASVEVSADGLPGDSVSVTGADAHPLVSALAIIVVTSALAVLAASPRVRQVVGVLTVAVSLVALWLSLTGGSGVDDALTDAVKKSPAYTGGSALEGEKTTIWSLASAAAFLLAAILGGITARFGRHWPTMSSRYEAPAARPSPATPQSDADMWKAMDDGRDPTQ